MADQLKSLKLLKPITEDYWETAHNARENGRYIAFTNAFSPVELLWAMDFIPIYPENHAVILGARKINDQPMAAAATMGYGPDLCSYARTDMGDLETGLSPVGGLPKPDLLVISNSQCGTLHKWFEVLARRWNAPMVLLDVPHAGNVRSGDETAVKTYVRSQMDELVKVMQDITGRRLEPDRLREVLRLGREASGLWTRILDAAVHRPAPLTVFDQFIAMAPIVAQRGTEVAVDFYRRLLAELDDRISSGKGAVPGEKHRLFWDNLPIWPELRSLSSYLAAQKASLCSAWYTRCWSNLSVDPEDPLDEWSGRWAEMGYSVHINLERRIREYVNLARRFELDGFIYHSNRSCKMISQFIPDLKQAVTKQTGLPGIIIEADHNDHAHYSMEKIRFKLDAFFEMI